MKMLANGGIELSFFATLLMINPNPINTTRPIKLRTSISKKCGKSVYQRKMKEKMSGKYNNNRGHQLKTYPAQCFPKYNIFPVNGCGIKSFQYQGLPEIKKNKSDSKNSRTQQGKSQHARQYKIDHSIFPARHFGQVPEH